MLTVDFDRLGLRPGERVLDMGVCQGRLFFKAKPPGSSGYDFLGSAPRPRRPRTAARPPNCTKHLAQRYEMTAPGGCPTTPVSAYLIGPLPSG